MMEIAWILLVAAWFWLWLTRPQLSKKNAIRNSIHLIVETNKHLSDSDKIVLIGKMIDEINFSNISKEQFDLLIEKLGNRMHA